MWLLVILIIFFVIKVAAANRKKKRELQRHSQLIELQNYIGDTNFSTLQMSEKQLMQETNRFITKHQKTLEKCEESLNNASTPKTYFPKLDSYNESVLALINLDLVCPWIISFKYASDSQLEQLTLQMIDRYWLECKEKSINAKSESSKKHALDVFFDTLQLYDSHLNDTTRAHIAVKRKEYDATYGKNTINISC